MNVIPHEDIQALPTFKYIYIYIYIYYYKHMKL